MPFGNFTKVSLYARSIIRLEVYGEDPPPGVPIPKSFFSTEKHNLFVKKLSEFHLRSVMFDLLYGR